MTNNPEVARQKRGRVFIDLAGRVVCPIHGALSPSAEYVPGVAECGCIFAEVAGSCILRRISDKHPQHCNDDGDQNAKTGT